MKKIANLLIFAGMLVFAGSAGSSDLGQISTRIILQNCILGAIFILLGYCIKMFVQRKNKCKIYHIYEKNNQIKLNFPV